MNSFVACEEVPNDLGMVSDFPLITSTVNNWQVTMKWQNIDPYVEGG